MSRRNSPNQIQGLNDLSGLDDIVTDKRRGSAHWQRSLGVITITRSNLFVIQSCIHPKMNLCNRSLFNIYQGFALRMQYQAHH